MFDFFRSQQRSSRIMLTVIILFLSIGMLAYLGNAFVGSRSSGDDIVAEVGNEAITVPEVQKVLQLNMRSGRMPPEMMAFQAPRIIDSMITEHALAYEAKRLGFKVSADELRAGIQQTIPQLFPDGKFAGTDAYERMLAQQNMTIEQFEADLSLQLLITRMRDVALEGTVVTPQEIALEYKRRNDKVKIEYVRIAGDKLRGEVQVTPEEVRKSYEANKPLYTVPEKRSLGILIVDQADVEQSIQPTDADLLRYYNEHKEEYRLPERVDVRHILLKTNASDPKQEAAIKAKAEDLVKQLRKGANFTEMVKKYSEDPGAKDKGGEYDGVVKGQMVPEFEKAAFSLKVNEISDPVKTTYGYHILQVLKHEQPTLKPFNDVKPQMVAELKKEQLAEKNQQIAEKAQNALTKDPAHPADVAKSLGVKYVTADNLGANDPLPEIGVNKDVQESLASLKKGEVSQPVPFADNKKIAMAVCTADTPAHPAAFEEVESKAREAAMKDKVNKLVDEKANQLMEKARANGGDLAAAAKSMGLELKTPDPVDRAGSIEGLGSAASVPDAFNKPAGSLFGPTPVPDGKIVAKVLEKIPADPAGLEAQRTALRDQIKSQKGQTRNLLFEQGVREALTREGKVKVHQDVVNRLIAGYHS